MGKPKTKKDMSRTCNLLYEEYWSKAHSNEMSQEEWDTWYDAHCRQCEYMGEVCMYGEQELKTLNVTLVFQMVGTTSIKVPPELSLKEAIEYAKEHIKEIPIPCNAEYICDSDEIDEENCEFEE